MINRHFVWQHPKIKIFFFSGGFIDTYKNLSYKNIFGKLWASEFCPQVIFLNSKVFIKSLFNVLLLKDVWTFVKIGDWLFWEDFPDQWVTNIKGTLIWFLRFYRQINIFITYFDRLSTIHNKI